MYWRIPIGEGTFLWELTWVNVNLFRIQCGKKFCEILWPGRINTSCTQTTKRRTQQQFSQLNSLLDLKVTMYSVSRFQKWDYRRGVWKLSLDIRLISITSTICCTQNLKTNQEYQQIILYSRNFYFSLQTNQSSYTTT